MPDSSQPDDLTSRADHLARRIADAERQINLLRREFATLQKELLQLPHEKADEASPAAEPSTSPQPPPTPVTVPTPKVTAPKPVPPPETKPVHKTSQVSPRDEKLPPPPKPKKPETEAPSPKPQISFVKFKDLETRIGTVWFNRIGLVALLVGFGLLARWGHPFLQPWHKVVVSYLIAVTLFATGYFLEPRLKLFARPVMAGGIALAFFVSFAAYFVEAMACVPLWASLFLMSASLCGLFICAERWRSESTAMLSIFLGHVAAFVAGGDADTFTLAAIVILSLAAVGLFIRHNWLPLTLFGVVISYVSHTTWAIQDHSYASLHHEFWLNFAFLSSYFAIFQASDLIYQFRRGRVRTGTYSKAQITTGRGTGPAALVLYAALVFWLFSTTTIYWPDIHYFLVPMGALQLFLTWVHLKFKNADYPIYTTAGILFITLGLFSWLEGLTLNMALALQALLLIVLSRRLDFWFLTPLAQSVLVVNFLHFWLSGASQPEKWPDFVGGLLTTVVYIVKSRLQETPLQEPREENFSTLPWVSRLQAWVNRDRHGFAVLHAVAGSLMAINLCAVFFDARWEALAVSILSVAIVGVVIILKSHSLMVSGFLLQAGAVLLLFRGQTTGSLLDSNTTLANWSINQICSFIFAATAYLFANRPKVHDSYHFAAGETGAWLFAALAWFLTLDKIQLPVWMLPLAFIGPALIWVQADRFMRGRAALNSAESKRFLDRLSILISEKAGMLRFLLAGAAAILTWRAMEAAFSSDHLGLWIYPSLTLIILFVSIRRDSPGFVFGNVVHALLGSIFACTRLDMEPGPSNTMLAWVLFSLVCSAFFLCHRAYRGKRGSFLCGGLIFLVHAWFMLVILYKSRFITDSFFLVWTLLFTFCWATIERFRTDILRAGDEIREWKDLPGVCVLKNWAFSISTTASAAFAVLLALMLTGFTETTYAACRFSLLFAFIFLLLAVLLRSPSLAAGYAVFLLATHVRILVDTGLKMAAMQAPWMTFSTFLFTLFAAAATEKFLERNKPNLRPMHCWWLEAGAWVVYLLALFHGGAFLGYRVDAQVEHSSLIFPAQMLIAAVLFRLAPKFSMSRLAIAAAAYAAWILLQFVTQPLADSFYQSWLHISGMLIGALLLLFENGLRRNPEFRLTIWDFDFRSGLRWAVAVALASTLLYAFHVSNEVRGGWTTLGWSLSGLFIMGYGFLVKEVPYRRTALAILGLCILRIVVIDIAGLELFYRMIAFMGLGISLILVSLLYSRFREEIHKWI